MGIRASAKVKRNQCTENHPIRCAVDSTSSLPGNKWSVLTGVRRLYIPFPNGKRLRRVAMSPPARRTRPIRRNARWEGRRYLERAASGGFMIARAARGARDRRRARARRRTSPWHHPVVWCDRIGACGAISWPHNTVVCTAGDEMHAAGDLKISPPPRG